MRSPFTWRALGRLATDPGPPRRSGLLALVAVSLALGSCAKPNTVLLVTVEDDSHRLTDTDIDVNASDCGCSNECPGFIVHPLAFDIGHAIRGRRQAGHRHEDRTVNVQDGQPRPVPSRDRAGMLNRMARRVREVDRAKNAFNPGHDENAVSRCRASWPAAHLSGQAAMPVEWLAP